jgi:hypothetical protein
MHRNEEQKDSTKSETSSAPDHARRVGFRVGRRARDERHAAEHVEPMIGG